MQRSGALKHVFSFLFVGLDYLSVGVKPDKGDVYQVLGKVIFLCIHKSYTFQEKQKIFGRLALIESIKIKVFCLVGGMCLRDLCLRNYDLDSSLLTFGQGTGNQIIN